LLLTLGGEPFGQLAEERRALRRVATLVAEGASTTTVCVAVVEEVVRVLGTRAVSLLRAEPDGFAAVVHSLNVAGFEPGSRWPLDGPSLTATVLSTGRPAHVSDYSSMPGTIARQARAVGAASAVGVPIIVDGRAWGVIAIGETAGDPLPVDIEGRLTEFVELLATGIANAESHERLRRLADENQSLQRVATLVAAGSEPGDLFPAISEEVARLIGSSRLEMVQYESDGMATVVGAVGDHPYPVGTTWPLDGSSVMESVRRTGQAARLDDFGELPGTVAEVARAAGVGSAAGAPIVVGGSVWGALIAFTSGRDAPLPEDTERRLGEFTHLVAIAVSNVEARNALSELAEEQTALRRVATLVAESAPPNRLFSAVAEEVARVLAVSGSEVDRYEPDGTAVMLAVWRAEGWESVDSVLHVGMRWPPDPGSLTAAIQETGRPARVDDYSEVSGLIGESSFAAGIGSACAAPIVVEGRLWGAIRVFSRRGELLAADAEVRLQAFTQLLATAISNSEARDGERRLAEEQATLRRLAVLVAERATSAERVAVPSPLYNTVLEEVVRILDAPAAWLLRYDEESSMTVLAAINDPFFEVGSQWPLDGTSVTSRVYETGRSARIDDFAELEGSIASRTRESGFRSSLGAPITVGGKVWGAVCVGTTAPEPLALDTEERLERFTDLLATAISNRQAQDDLQSLADEQAALRRVATLVAGGAPPDELLTGVATEVMNLLRVSGALLDRFEPNGTVVTLATAIDPEWREAREVAYPGRTWPLEPESLPGMVRLTGRPARADDYSRRSGSIATTARAVAVGSGCATPIVVDGELWGLIRVFSRQGEPLPADAEARLQGFTELVAAAISNADAREHLHGLVEEQAALRRVATLVARGADSTNIFDAVCAEAGELLGATSVNLSHYTSDGDNVTMAGWSKNGRHVPVGARFPHTPDTIGGRMVKTWKPVRIDSWDDATSDLARLVRDQGTRSSLGTPILVEGQLWGALVAATDRDEPLPEGTDARLTRFTELVATAISNATTRTELVASRARIIAAGDEARRKIERDLHDGTQQRLISLGFDVQRVLATVPSELQETRAGLERIDQEIDSVLDDVRKLSRGLHPTLLANAGLAQALRALVRAQPVVVDLGLELEGRLPDAVEIAVYYVVSEALTNAARHSQAHEIGVTVIQSDAKIVASIEDDGVGGAAPDRGSGLMGLVDRVEALGGRLAIQSPAGGGTVLTVELPIGQLA
jgi:GAF domain-containing protein